MFHWDSYLIFFSKQSALHSHKKGREENVGNTPLYLINSIFHRMNQSLNLANKRKKYNDDEGLIRICF